jgi:diacylglycerol O-acyltransferase
MTRDSPDRLNYQDAGLLNFDRDTFPHNIGSVGIFEGSIPFGKYLAHVERRLDLVPRYRQRVIRVPLDLANPIWHDDPTFDIRRHVRSVTLPPPGDDAQLARLAGEFFALPLDRDLPLWGILLVRGLSAGRTAQLVKAHHCLVDGVGGVQLLVALLDTTPDPPPLRRRRKPKLDPIPDRATLFANAIYDQVLEQADAAERLTRSLLRPGSLVHWGRSVAGALLAAAPYILERAPDAPWNTRLSSPRRLAWQDVPLQEARAICAALGGKVNDLVLAVLAGALRRYYELHGWDTKDVTLRVAVPVNARRDPDDRALGNHVSLMLAGLPLGLADPRERFEAVSQQMTSLKGVDQASGFENLLRLLGRIPGPVQAALGGRLAGPNVFTNLICTNVRGPETPLYCLGHPMIAHYPWVLATWRMGLSVAVMSYLHSIYFSFTGDAGVLPDLDRMAGFLREDFWQLHGAVTRARRRPSPPAAAKRSRASAPKRSRGRAASAVSQPDGRQADQPAGRRPPGGAAGRSPSTNGRSPEPRVLAPTGSARRRAGAARRGKEAS